MRSDVFNLVEGILRIYRWERKDFRGVPTIIFEDKNIIPFCGRRHIGLMATDPSLYASRKISYMALGFHTPTTDYVLDALDLHREHMESNIPPVGPETSEGVYKSITDIDIPVSTPPPSGSYPSHITYKVNRYSPSAPRTLTEEGLFAVHPWDTAHQTEENTIIAYKRLSTSIAIDPSMTLDIWHQIRYGSTT